MDKFLYTEDLEVFKKLSASGFKFLYARDFNGKLTYVFLNNTEKINNYNFTKEQLFTTNQLFF